MNDLILDDTFIIEVMIEYIEENWQDFAMVCENKGHDMDDVENEFEYLIDETYG